MWCPVPALGQHRGLQQGTGVEEKTYLKVKIKEGISDVGRQYWRVLKTG